MIDVETAAQIAEKFLNEHFQLDDDVVVVTDVEQQGDYYLFQYNSRKYLETGDLLYAIVEGHPIAVNRQDGSIG